MNELLWVLALIVLLVPTAVLLYLQQRWWAIGYFLAGFLLVAILGFRTFVYEPFRVSSDSMHPTLREGDFIWVRKLALAKIQGSAKPLLARGDIILFRPVTRPDSKFVSRLIGMPGDHLVCRERQLFINDQEVPTTPGAADGPYQYATQVIGERTIQIAWMLEREPAECDVVIPEREYFVLGDSRENARDSRYLGTVPEETIDGVIADVPIRQ